MSEQTYAGHTLAAIKAAAEGMKGWNCNEVRRVGEDEICEFGTELDGEWYPIGTIDAQTYTGEPADDLLVARHIATANPATVLAMAARIEELERDVIIVVRELERAQSSAKHGDAALTDAMRWMAEVRHACGDDGKRIQPELVEYVGEMAKDAARYRQLRRGQRWSVIDGIGKSLRADELDAAIDAAMEQTKNREGA